MEFCKAFNAQTQGETGTVIPVVITVYEDRSFTFVTKTPPAAVLIKQALRDRQGLGRAQPHEGRHDHPGAAARDRRAQARGPERPRRRPGREDHRRYRPIDGRRGGVMSAHHGSATPRRWRRSTASASTSPPRPSRSSRASPSAKFDESVELHVRTGLNVRHADEQLRGTIALPNGLGKDVKIIVFAQGAEGRRGRSGRRRRGRRRGSRETDRGGLRRLRRRDRHARPDVGRRPPRTRARAVGQDAEPEGRHGHDGRRQSGRGVQVGQGRVPHRPQRDRAHGDRQGELRRASAAARTTPR